MKTGTKNSILAMGILGIFMGSTAIVSAAYFNNAPAPSCGTQITRTLQVGSENNDVYTLQSFLSRAGYLTANPNGYFGPATKSAVKNFQADNYISSTGVVGESTINAINERLCDTNVRAGLYSSSYGYSSSDTTYVDAYDPYARIVSPQVTTPVVYTNPINQNSTVHTTVVNSNPVVYTNPQSNVVVSSVVSTPVINNTVPVISPIAPAYVPSNFQLQTQTGNVVYNPSTGYSYGIVPQSGTLTITSPGVNSHYNEGDTVDVSWTTSNFVVSQSQILLENVSTGQNRVVAVTSGNNSSFVLTKDLLDAVCAGPCDNYQNSFRIVVTTPMVDIAGNLSMFRAAVAPIVIKRPIYFPGSVSINVSKNPVNSGEVFRLFVNIPIPALYNNNTAYNNQFSFNLHAVCKNNVQVVIAGVPCGQDFTIPFNPNNQQQIPVTITNPTYYQQDIVFQITVINSLGQIVGTAQTTATVNATPFSF